MSTEPKTAEEYEAYAASGAPKPTVSTLLPPAVETTSCFTPLPPDDYARMQALKRDPYGTARGNQAAIPTGDVKIQLQERDGPNALRTEAYGQSCDMVSPPLEVLGYLNISKVEINFKVEEDPNGSESHKAWWAWMESLFGPKGQLAGQYAKHYGSMLPGKPPKRMKAAANSGGVATDLNLRPKQKGEYWFSCVRQNCGDEENLRQFKWKVRLTEYEGQISPAEKAAVAAAFDEGHPLRTTLLGNGLPLKALNMTVADGLPISGWNHGPKWQWMPILNAVTKKGKEIQYFKGLFSLQMSAQATWVEQKEFAGFTVKLYANGSGMKLYATKQGRQEGPDTHVLDEDAVFFKERAHKRNLALTTDDISAQ